MTNQFKFGLYSIAVVVLFYCNSSHAQIFRSDSLISIEELSFYGNVGHTYGSDLGDSSTLPSINSGTLLKLKSSFGIGLLGRIGYSNSPFQKKKINYSIQITGAEKPKIRTDIISDSVAIIRQKVLAQNQLSSIIDAQKKLDSVNWVINSMNENIRGYSREGIDTNGIYNTIDSLDGVKSELIDQYKTTKTKIDSLENHLNDLKNTKPNFVVDNINIGQFLYSHQALQSGTVMLTGINTGIIYSDKYKLNFHSGKSAFNNSMYNSVNSTLAIGGGIEYFSDFHSVKIKYDVFNNRPNKSIHFIGFESQSKLGKKLVILNSVTYQIGNGLNGMLNSKLDYKMTKNISLDAIVQMPFGSLEMPIQSPFYVPRTQNRIIGFGFNTITKRSKFRVNVEERYRDNKRSTYTIRLIKTKLMHKFSKKLQNINTTQIFLSTWSLSEMGLKLNTQVLNTNNNLIWKISRIYTLTSSTIFMRTSGVYDQDLFSESLLLLATFKVVTISGRSGINYLNSKQGYQKEFGISTVVRNATFSLLLSDDTFLGSRITGICNYPGKRFFISCQVIYSKLPQLIYNRDINSEDISENQQSRYDGYSLTNYNFNVSFIYKLI